MTSFIHLFLILKWKKCLPSEGYNLTSERPFVFEEDMAMIQRWIVCDLMRSPPPHRQSPVMDPDKSQVGEISFHRTRLSDHSGYTVPAT